MLKLEKKQIQIFSVVVAMIFIGSVVALGMSQLTAVTGVASAASSSSVGVIDFRQAMSQNPALEAANKQFQQEVESAQADFDAKSASMSEEDKAAFYQQTQERLAQRQGELLEPVQKAVEQAAKEVADAKGLSVVIDKGAADGISEVASNSSAVASAIYNLAGQRVLRMLPGQVYVSGGKKFVMK